MSENIAKKIRFGRIIAVAAILLFTALVALWWHAFHAPQERLVLYFSQNIYGIDVGTPVKIMGVSVGQIESIDLQIPENRAGGHYCPAVHIVLDGRKLVEKGMPENLSDIEVLRKEIDRGLRGKMALLSPMTGDYFINLIYDQSVPAELYRDPALRIPEIPGINTGIDDAIDSATKTLTKFAETDFLQIERDINETLDDLEITMAPENFAQFNEDLSARLQKARSILADPALKAEIENVNKQLEKIRIEIRTRGTDFLTDLAAGQDELASLQNSVVKIGLQAEEVRQLTDIQSPDLRNVRRQIRKLVRAIDNINGTIQTPFRLAVPAQFETGKISPTDQSER